MTSHPDPDPFRPVAVEPRDGYRIWLRYADGVEGEVNLSHLVGKGVFAAWRHPDFFAGVHIAAGDGIAWSEELDLCPDALYLQITGKSPEDIWPALKEQPEGLDRASCKDRTVTSIPEVSRFYGIVIRIHTEDHTPPHVHARYGEAEAAIGIRRFEVLHGRLPPTALGLVVEWMARHQDKLLAAWERAQRDGTSVKIAPLD